MMVTTNLVFIDPTLSIQDAIDALGTEGGTIYLRPGTYLLTDTITFPTDRPVRLVGAGADITILDWIGMGATPNQDCIKVQYSRSGVEELTVKGPYVAGTGRGIAVGSTSHTVRDCRFRNVLIRNTCAEAIAFLGTAELGGSFITFLNVCEDCVFRSNFQAGATSQGMCYVGASCTTTRFVRCSFDTFKGSAITDFTGIAGGGIELLSCNIEAPADDAQHWIILSASRWPKIHNCWFENTTGFFGKYKIIAINGCIGLSVRDCSFACIEGTPLWIACGVASSGTYLSAGASLINNWIEINAGDPVGATIMVFGSANETPSVHVVAGGGIKNHGAGTFFTWATHYTDTAGAVSVRDTA